MPVVQRRIVQALYHPEPVFLDPLADWLFAAWQMVAIEQVADLLTPALEDHALERLVFLEKALDFIGSGDCLKQGNNLVPFTRIQKRNIPVMRTGLSIQIPGGQRVTPSAQLVNHQG